MEQNTATQAGTPATPPRKIRIDINGGLGKAIAATAAIQAVRDQIPPGSTIHVHSPYPDVFRQLACIDRTYQAGHPIPYLLEVQNDFEILRAEPYERLAFRQGREHLADAFSRGWGFKPPENLAGKIRLTDQEHEAAMRLCAQIDRSKPWVAIQPWGGTSFYDPGQAADPLRPKQVRDMPADVAQGIVNSLTAAGAIVIQFSLPTERRLEKVVFFDLGRNQQNQPNVMHPRLLFSCLNLCEYLVGIDSTCQHAWAALGKPAGKSVILWGATNPKNFSYAIHKDLALPTPCPTPHCGRPDMVIGDLCDGNNVWVCPHAGACMRHNPENVVRELGLKVPAGPAVSGPIPAPTVSGPIPAACPAGCPA